MGSDLIESILRFLGDSGIAGFFSEGGWKAALMVLLALAMLYLAVFRKFEPYLLIPIAFGMLLVNIPGSGMFVKTTEVVGTETVVSYSGLLGYLYYGVKFGIYPCLIFLGIGATTDFGPLIANPRSMLLGAAAQIGIFVTFLGAILFGFSAAEAASIGIIGGADGPTAILLTSRLAPDLLGPISLAAYSYMALVPFIQPPIIRLLTTKRERLIRMTQLRPVGRVERIVFPIAVTVLCGLIVPSSVPLIGMLMLGNLIKESGVVPNLVETAGKSLLYIVTILLGLSVGATATADAFLSLQTLFIVGLGLFAFGTATAAGVLGGKLMNVLSKGKVNPMIGAAGVSAVPMSARVVQLVGQKDDPENFLLMHAMGPNVAGVIGSAVAAGLLFTFFG
ncbi:MAG: sodium ion-translocating decarboxylase subunit beta [Candidatus Izemoplasmatales bacterium]